MPKTGESAESRHKRMLEAQSKDGFDPMREGDVQRFVDRSRVRLGDHYDMAKDRMAVGMGEAAKSDVKTKADIRGRPKRGG